MRNNNVYIQGSNGVFRTDVLVVPTWYVTKFERPLVKCHNAFSSIVWCWCDEDFRCLEASDRRHLRIISRIGCSDRVRNVQVRILALSAGSRNILPDYIKRGELCWLSHVSLMPNARLPQLAVVSVPPSECKRWLAAKSENLYSEFR